VKIVAIDLGVGNLGSLANVLRRIGHVGEITHEAKAIEQADRLILPGVGAFDPAANALDTLGIREILKRKVIDDRTPILGICLGMQLLLERSEEGNARGLGWIRGNVRRFSFDGVRARLKVPHMGWNTVSPRGDSPLFAGSANNRFYFVHSYFVDCDDPNDIAGTTRYGVDFVAAVTRHNVMGVQFHPEKSHSAGQNVIARFLEH
jgi:glutamine amidotransferase